MNFKTSAVVFTLFLLTISTDAFLIPHKRVQGQASTSFDEPVFVLRGGKFVQVPDEVIYEALTHAVENFCHQQP